MFIYARNTISTPSSIVYDKSLSLVATAVTLVSIALLTSSLRVYTNGRLVRSFAIDDWLMLLAALCLIGVLVTFACHIGPWTPAWSLLHVLGIGFVKLSVASFLVRVFRFDRRRCRYALYIMIGLLIPLTFVWFCSILLQCVSVANAWNQDTQLKSRCISRSTSNILSLVNNLINAATDSVLVLSALPIVWNRSYSLTNRVLLLVVLCLGSIACAAATFRTHMLFKSWKNGDGMSIHRMSLFIWSITTIELATALTATNLPTLLPLAKAILALMHNGCSTTATNSVTPLPSQPLYSGLTIISRPNTAFFPSFTRFHDDVSNLDFDIETSASRTRTYTTRSRATHSRNPSDWSQFSGFTYYTNPTEPPERDSPTEQPGGVGMTELEEIFKGLGLGRQYDRGLDIELAITALSEEPPHQRLDGMELPNMRDATTDEGTEVSARRHGDVDPYQENGPGLITHAM